jgi:small-conductance mechanosensitive channel
MPQDVEITPRLGTALRDFADVTFSITVSADAPPDRVRSALRRVRDALWEVGRNTPLPTGDLPTPSYVSQPAGREHGPWVITVDFDFAPREERTRVPDLIAGILREFEVTPARLDVFADDR